jgi:RHS repeat-associated protein
MRWLKKISLFVLLGSALVTVGHAQQRLRVSVGARYKPEQASGTFFKLKLGENGPEVNAEVTASVLDLQPRGSVGFVDIDEGGAGFVVTLHGKYVHSSQVQFTLTDRRDDFVVLTDGRANLPTFIGTVFAPDHEETKTVVVTVLNKSRLKSRLGGGKIDLVGACSSPYLKPISGGSPGAIEVLMDLNLGLTKNGQALPPLRLGYLNGGYTMPPHSDIVEAEPVSVPFEYYRRRFYLPQATLTITNITRSTYIHPYAGIRLPDETGMKYEFSARGDEANPYVTYEYFGKSGNFITVLDGATGQTHTEGSLGTEVKWVRTYHASETSRQEESNGPQLAFGYSPMNGGDFSLSDWHETGKTADRILTFQRFLEGPNHADLADEVITKDAAGTISSRNRVEYQRYDTEIPGAVDDDSPIPISLYESKRSIRGFGSARPIVTERMLTEQNEVRGTKEPGGATTVSLINDTLGTTLRTLRTLGDTSPTVSDTSAPTIPAGLLVTEYEYDPDWTGLSVLPKKIVTKADGKVVSDITNAYALNQTINFDGHEGKAEKFFVTTSTANDGADGIVAVSKKFQSDTFGFFYADLAFSKQNPDGTKVSYAYQRGSGTIAANGSGFSLVSDADINQFGTDTNLTRFVTITGVKKDTPGGVNISSSSTLGSISFDELAVVEGRSTANVEIRQYGFPVRVETWVYLGGDFHQIAWENLGYTPYGGLKSRSTSNGSSYAAEWEGFRKKSETDETGQRVEYIYDAAGRAASVTRAAIAFNGIEVPEQRTAYVYDSDNHIVTLTVGPADGVEKLVTTSQYDLAGQLENQTSPDGTTLSTCVYSDNGHQVTTTLPSGATKVDDYAADGRLKQSTGTAVIAQYYSYGFDPANRPTTTTHVGSPTGRSAVETSDLMGRPAERRTDGFFRAGGSKPIVTRYSYDGAGRLKRIRVVEMDGAVENRVNSDTLFTYDIMGQIAASGSDLDATPDGILTAASRDRFSSVERRFFQDEGGIWWAATTTRTYHTDDSAAVHESSAYSRLSGLSTGLMNEVTAIDLRGNRVHRRTFVDPATKTRIDVSENLDRTRSVQVFAGGFLVQEKILDDTADISSAAALGTIHKYDALGRRVSSTDSRGIVSRLSYKPNTALVERVYGRDAQNQEILLSTLGYDSAGRITSSTNNAKNPAATSSYGYNSRNQVIDESGDGAFPAHHVYDEFGQQIELWTWRHGAGAETQADKTVWVYDANTGLLKSKSDAAGKSVSYDYFSDISNGERVVTRQWARGTLTTYRYKLSTGELASVDYNDGTHPIDYKYTRTGQVEAVDDATGRRIFAYDYEQLSSERLGADDGNWYHGLALTTLREDGVGTHTANGRYRGFQLGYAGNPEAETAVGFGYDGFGRINGLTARYPSAGISTLFNYDYRSDASLWEKFTHNSYSVKREFEDGRNIITSITAQRAVTAGDAIISQHVYRTNAAGEHESVIQAGSAFGDFGGPTLVNYSYDGKGQLENAAGYLGEDADMVGAADELPGRHFGYQHDLAGNRKSASVDSESVDYHGDAGESGANSLNQIKQRGTLRTHFSGTAESATTVSVDGNTAARRDQYWDQALPEFGQSRPISVNTSTGGSESRLALVRPAQESFEYDDDGNLKKDALWEYFWDAENRLIGMSTRSNDFGTLGYSSAPPSVQITFLYDYLGRRVSKKVSNGSNVAYYQRYVYDGANLVAEFDPSSNKITRSYVWGLDLTGALGGVGALVLETVHTLNGLATYDVACDGSGNVTALIATATGAIAAAYEYDPFGQILRSVGAESKTNPYRYSSKFTDQESGLIYYGLRYYDPSLGRFINRDPSAEAGGNNLYRFVGNSPVNRVDYLGLGADDIVALAPFVVNGKKQDDPDYDRWSANQDFLDELFKQKPDTEFDPIGVKGDLHEGSFFIRENFVYRVTGRNPEGGWYGVRWDLGYAKEVIRQENIRRGKIILASLAAEAATLTVPSDLKIAGMVAGQFTLDILQVVANSILSLNPLVAVSMANGNKAYDFSENVLVDSSLYRRDLVMTLPAMAVMAAGFIEEAPALGALKSTSEVVASSPTGKFYSVAFEMKIEVSVFGRARGVHFNRANAALDAALKSDASFAAQMEELIPGVKDAVSKVGGRETPADWIWHHESEGGLMRLVPEEQHTPGSMFWETLHPGGKGGYSIWAIPAGAPPN